MPLELDNGSDKDCSQDMPNEIAMYEVRGAMTEIFLRNMSLVMKVFREIGPQKIIIGWSSRLGIALLIFFI
jgi:hypothetical protein